MEICAYLRTSITIDESLLKKAQKISGKSGYSEAIVTSLQDYVAMKERLSYLKRLFEEKPPHSYRKIKTDRRKNPWSS
jgi:hypothetical protein